MIENKWLPLLVDYSKGKEIGICPKCKGKIEVIPTENGRKSVTFHCLSCNEFAHFDGEIEKNRIKTPLGELFVYIDGMDVVYDYHEREKSSPCKDVDGRYLIEINFQPDGLTDHVIECVFKRIDDMKYERSYESGECLECQAFYSEKCKLSIGTHVNNDGEDYEVDYLDNGMAYLISPETKNCCYSFGISWINNCTEENECQTWFGADPYYP